MFQRLGWPTWPQWRQLPNVLTRKERLAIVMLIAGAIASGVGAVWMRYLERTAVIPTYGGTYTEAVVGEPRFINPLLAGINDVDRDLMKLVYSGLLEYNEKGVLVPGLAERYEVSEDKLTYTFFLRNGVQWHDGKPFTADDVVFTVAAILQPEYASPLRSVWQGIAVEKIDAGTVRFALPKPYSQFPERATVGIMPRHVWESIAPKNMNLADANLKPVGTGPYRFSNFVKDKFGNVISYTLEANSRYWRGAPYINAVTFSFFLYEDEAVNAYRKGKVMGIANIAPRNRIHVEERGTAVYKLHIPKYFAVFFNQSRSKPLVDKNIRKALALATDKERIVREVLGRNGSVVDSPILPWMEGYSEHVTRYPFSPEEAVDLLETSGWLDKNGDGVREKVLTGDKEPTSLEIVLSTSDFADLIQAGNILKENWEAIGVRVHLETTNVDELKQNVIRPRRHEALLFGEALTLAPDLYPFWHSSQKKDPGLNLSLYDNKEVDRLVEEIRDSRDESVRAENLRKAQDIIADELPALFLFSPDYLYAVSEQVRNIDASNINIPAQRFSGIEKWYMETTRVEKQ